MAEGDPVHVESIHLEGFKRFTDTHFTGIPLTARLIVLAGPNGSGKSSLFDGLKTWHWLNGGAGGMWDEAYGTKVGTPSRGWPEHVHVTFHEPLPDGPDEKKKLIYARTAFRNEADFNVANFSRLGSPLDESRTARMIDTDVAVSQNYQRLIMQTIDGIYDTSLPDSMSKGELRDRIIGKVRAALTTVFPDLLLTGVGGLGGSQSTEGTFYFTKGSSEGFLYKNLSAGEKAAFDLILDLVIKTEFFNNTIWCIDEPETHLNSRVQARLLLTMVELLPPDCQLWLASHSIGFMKQAWELAQSAPGSVTFIDMEDRDFDHAITVEPIEPNREFWIRTLNVALGDLATLVAPSRVVLCEGRPKTGADDMKAAFDASCYRQIFAAGHPDVDFVSVGSASEAVNDRLGIAHALQTIAPGTLVTRLIDRDFRSPQEIAVLEQEGTRVLGRRHLEAYLFDDEVIAALCAANGQPDRADEALAVKAAAIDDSIGRGNDPDDVKRSTGSLCDGLRRLLSLPNPGSTSEAFARDTMAPLLHAGMQTYAELDASVFG